MITNVWCKTGRQITLSLLVHYTWIIYTYFRPNPIFYISSSKSINKNAKNKRGMIIQQTAAYSINFFWKKERKEEETISNGKN